MKRITACIMALVMLLSLTPPVFAADNSSVISIGCADDLVRLSDNCALDTWSYNKTVVLTCDIDLSGVDYKSIPVFSGTFDGQGYTIKNLKISCSGSVLGLFRHIGRGGSVKNLNVVGSVLPDGIKESIGGIAGQNSGTISNCTFSGSVAGSDAVGGIAGENDAYGLISGCAVSGTVSGNTKIGGICGDNSGSILNCVNCAEINTLPVEFSASSVISDVLASESVTDITDTVKDIGGIAGLSSGIVNDCTNNGNVGYTHIGYNIGGIVGRLSGGIKRCANNAAVYGRRGTGGIAGQMEPFTSWVISENALVSLRNELGSLNSMIDTLLDDTQSQSDALAGQLKDSIACIDSAENAFDGLIVSTTDFVNGNIDSVNEVSTRISDFLRGTEKVTDELSLFFNNLDEAADNFTVFTDELKLSVDDLDPAVDCLTQAMSFLSSGFSEIEVSLGEISNGLDNLRKSLGDPDAMYYYMQTLSDGFLTLSSAIDAAGLDISALVNNLSYTGNYYYSFLDSLQTNLTQLGSDIAGIGEAAALIAQEIHSAAESGELDNLSLSLNDFSQAIGKASSSLHGTFQSFEYLNQGILYMINELQTSMPYIAGDLSAAGAALSAISGGIGGAVDQLDIRAMTDALSEFSTAMDTMSAAFGNISTSVDVLQGGDVYIKDSLAHLSASLGAASAMSVSLRAAASDLERTSDAAGDLISEFAEKEPVKFVRIDESFTDAQKQLFDALKKLSASVVLMADTASSDMIIEDLRRVSDQLFKTFGILIDLADSVSDVSVDPDDYQDDISVGSEQLSSGSIDACINQGDINSDYNAGGIVGTISVEISADLENDLNLSGLLTQNVKHLIYAVIRRCENYSGVAVKYNNAGGIVGSMDYGYIVNSICGGNIISTNGDYVGGIAGYSAGNISKCLSRVNLSGNNYIGGIAGKGSVITDCYTMAYIDRAAERAGAVTGSCTDEISDNYFFDNGVDGGIDGISYAGKAEPLTYETLLEATGAQSVFSETVVTFIKDGVVLAEISVPFGASVDTLPEVPNNGDKYWVWDNFNRDAVYCNITVEGKYCSPLATISTDEEIPLFLTEGKFYTDQKLTVTEWAPDFAALGIDEVSEFAAYSLSVNDYSGALTVRMKHESGGRLYILNDGKLSETAYKTDGNYLVFTIENGDHFVLITFDSANYLPLILIVSAAVIAAVVIILIVRVKSAGVKKKRWHSKNTEK